MNVSNFTNLTQTNLSDILRPGNLSTSSLFSAREILALTILALVIAFISVITNGVVIFAVLFGQNSFEDPNNLLLLSQAAAHLCTNLIGGSTYVYNLHDWIFKYYLVIGKCTALASLGSITFLTINRLISICWALDYPRIVTVKRVKLAIALLWIVSGILCSLNIVGQKTDTNELQRNFRYLGLVCVLAVVLCHIVIHNNASRHRKAIKTQIRAIAGQQAKVETDFTLIRSTLVVLIYFIISWVPVIFLTLFVDRDKSPKDFQRYYIRFSICVLGSCAVDPIIYYILNEDFRLFLKRFKRIYIAPRLEFTEPRKNPMGYPLKEIYNGPKELVINNSQFHETAV